MNVDNKTANVNLANVTSLVDNSKIVLYQMSVFLKIINFY